MHIQQLDQLIPTLEPYFTTKAPFQIPTGGREFIVKVAPWVVLILAAILVLGLFGQLSLLGLGTAMLNSYGIYVPQSGLYLVMAWVALAVNALTVVLYLMAFSGLKNFQESGWRYMFYAEGLAVIMALASLIGGFNLNGFLGSALSLIIALYILFQVRDYYTGKAKVKPVPATK